MANNCSVAYCKPEKEKLLAGSQGTDEIFAKASDLKRQGMALGNQAAALESLERLEELWLPINKLQISYNKPVKTNYAPSNELTLDAPIPVG